jgi:hypothetical protein
LVWSNIVRRSNIVAYVFSTNPLNISFQRNLNNSNRRLWYELVLSIVHIHFNNDANVIRWNLHQNGELMVHLMYLPLIYNEVISGHMKIKNTGEK